MLISELADKKILIAGFGREGQDSFLFLRKLFSEKSLGIADKKEFDQFPKKIQQLLNKDRKLVLYFGDNYLKQAKAYDVVVKAPGIPLRVLNAALGKKQIITTQTNIFFANCPGIIVGVTGTKGKSTTATMLYEVLRAGGKKAHLVGNIEQPALQFLHGATPEDIFVYELSSAQLESARQSPHVAVLLNLYPEHLDYHGTQKAYRQAKANITKFQGAGDFFLFNEADENVAKIAETSKAKKLGFKPKKQKEAAFIAAVEPAFLVGKIFNIPQEKVEKAVRQLKPLPHRLQLVGTHKGITFYNDSLATIPEAAVAALDRLGPQVRTLIAGGFDRGILMEKLAHRIIKSKVQTLVLFPTTGDSLAKEIERIVKTEGLKKTPQMFFVNSMATAVQLAYHHTPKGGVCLLSPAASSFNLFRDYKERGEQFEKFVKHYARK